ncbi:MAG: DUF4230 domain-containing protein [Polyangiales bacterium]|nr:DUF4230 domain-containing protein [Myxococcales bacterium]
MVEPRRTGWRVALATAGLAVVAGFAWTGSLVGTCAYRMITAPKSADETIHVRPTPSVIVAVRSLARLETVTHHVERIVDLRDRQERLFGLVTGEDTILLVASGDVTAGVDLSELRDGDVEADFDRRVARIVLPPPRVFSTRLSQEGTYVYERRTDVFAKRREDLESRARAEAERTLEDAAVQGGILTQARTHAETTLTALVRSLGYETVEVVWRKE